MDAPIPTPRQAIDVERGVDNRNPLLATWLPRQLPGRLAVDRARWVDAFVAYMTGRGVKSENGELRQLAEELYKTQGHLDPAVVGRSPCGLHLREAQKGGSAVT
jgi:hypothetical protein